MAAKPKGSNMDTDPVPNEVILHYTHELSRTKRAMDEAGSAHRLMVKRAKADGVPSDAILESIAMSRMDPADRLRKLGDRIRVEAIRYPESTEALTDLFGRMDTTVSEKARMTDTLFDAETRGYTAGKYAVPVEDNPYEAGTEMHAIWRQYWGRGQAANVAALGEGAKPADASRKKPSGKKAAAGPKEPELPGVPPKPKRMRKSRAKMPNLEEPMTAH